MRLTKPPTQIKPRYDVVIVGSGYGGAVSASRLSRAGLDVCVLERGREIVTGEFPARFPQMAKEMQLTGARLRTGSDTGLYDVRIGDDMHVLVGCGVGGGSLVNAGVALRPDPRVLADPVWPDAVRNDGLLTEGYARAERWLRPARHADVASLQKYRVLEASGAVSEQRRWPRPWWFPSRPIATPPASCSRPVPCAATAALGATSAPRTHWR